MAATVFGTLANLLAHLLDGSTKYATPVIAGVEGPDGTVRAQQGDNDGNAKVAVAGTASVTGTELATMAEGDYLVSVTATTFDPPLRGLVNNGTAGKITVKAYGDNVAKEVYLAQGGQYSMTRIKEVTAIAAGMDVVGTR